MFLKLIIHFEFHNKTKKLFDFFKGFTKFAIQLTKLLTLNPRKF